MARAFWIASKVGVNRGVPCECKYCPYWIWGFSRVCFWGCCVMWFCLQHPSCILAWIETWESSCLYLSSAGFRWAWVFLVIFSFFPVLMCVCVYMCKYLLVLACEGLKVSLIPLYWTRVAHWTLTYSSRQPACPGHPISLPPGWWKWHVATRPAHLLCEF